ncbi:hypothetical protein NDU88_002849 [Pleurodeles waltl]|uniref:Uncharacterized protein n=1 Tax=Pleurodeles waltl TaxID=8319 RepID=A0AAV7SBR2_PLEWA|nr:hypothetical protein NDU88_002849 [Pleurodeles waltl]
MGCLTECVICGGPGLNTDPHVLHLERGAHNGRPRADCPAWGDRGAAGRLRAQLTPERRLRTRSGGHPRARKEDWKVGECPIGWMTGPWQWRAPGSGCRGGA